MDHPMGTDSLGRDILTRVLYAGRVDFLFALVVTVAGLLIGLTLGSIAGYFGRATDTVIMRSVDILMAFPLLVVILAFVAAFGPGLTGAYVGLIVVGWAVYARLARAEMLVVREQPYILAARTLGLSRRRILVRHAVPNVVRPALVFSMADMVLAILVLSSLSYFGLGVQPPTAEWGAMVADGQDVLLTAWWVSTLPGLWIVLAGIGFSLLGDGIADWLGTELKLVP